MAPVMSAMRRIAAQAGRGVGTVSRCMKRLGLSRLKSPEPPAPVVRYERAAPGELLHLDTKKLGRIDGVGHRITGERRSANRGIGWDMVHLAIDDHSRVSFALIKTDERGENCAQFLREAVAYYASLGVRIDRVMTDNGSGSSLRRSGPPAFSWASATYERARTRRRPTGRPSALFRPACGSGPMRGRT